MQQVQINHADGGSDAASACPDGYARTDGYGDPRADPDDGTGANCHVNAADGYYATHGSTYRRGVYTHPDAHLTAGPADGYGNDQHYHNGVARYGVVHPFEPSDLRPPRLEALDRRRPRLPGCPKRGDCR